MSDQTDFIKRQALKYSPVVIRGCLWIGIAMITDFRHSLTDLMTKTALGPLDWIESLSGAVLQGLIAWRLFLDQSYGRWQDEQKAKA